MELVASMAENEIITAVSPLEICSSMFLVEWKIRPPSGQYPPINSTSGEISTVPSQHIAVPYRSMILYRVDEDEQDEAAIDDYPATI